MNPSVAGKLPNRNELAEWDEARYLSFLRFCELFIESSPKGARWCITRERREEAETLAQSNSHISEFLQQLHLPCSYADATEKKFYFKLATMVRLVFGYLRLYPERITPQMREVMAPNRRFNWCLTAEHSKTVVVESRPADMNELLAGVHAKTVDLCHRLLDSITEEDIRRMSPKDRLLALSRF